MVDAHAIAESRTARMTCADSLAFMVGFHQALRVARLGGDLDGLWARAYTNPHTPSAALAGLVEGLAAGRGGRD